MQSESRVYKIKDYRNHIGPTAIKLIGKKTILVQVETQRNINSKKKKC